MVRGDHEDREFAQSENPGSLHTSLDLSDSSEFSLARISDLRDILGVSNNSLNKNMKCKNETLLPLNQRVALGHGLSAYNNVSNPLRTSSECDISDLHQEYHEEEYNAIIAPVKLFSAGVKNDVYKNKETIDLGSNDSIQNNNNNSTVLTCTRRVTCHRNVLRKSKKQETRSDGIDNVVTINEINHNNIQNKNNEETSSNRKGPVSTDTLTNRRTIREDVSNRSNNLQAIPRATRLRSNHTSNNGIVPLTSNALNRVSNQFPSRKYAPSVGCLPLDSIPERSGTPSIADSASISVSIVSGPRRLLNCFSCSKLKDQLTRLQKELNESKKEVLEILESTEKEMGSLMEVIESERKEIFSLQEINKELNKSLELNAKCNTTDIQISNFRKKDERLISPKLINREKLINQIPIINSIDKIEVISLSQNKELNILNEVERTIEERTPINKTEIINNNSNNLLKSPISSETLNKDINNIIINKDSPVKLIITRRTSGMWPYFRGMKKLTRKPNPIKRLSKGVGGPTSSYTPVQNALLNTVWKCNTTSKASDILDRILNQPEIEDLHIRSLATKLVFNLNKVDPSTIDNCSISMKDGLQKINSNSKIELNGNCINDNNNNNRIADKEEKDLNYKENDVNYHLPISMERTLSSSECIKVTKEYLHKNGVTLSIAQVVWMRAFRRLLDEVKFRSSLVGINKLDNNNSSDLLFIGNLMKYVKKILEFVRDGT